MTFSHSWVTSAWSIKQGGFWKVLSSVFFFLCMMCQMATTLSQLTSWTQIKNWNSFKYYRNLFSVLPPFYLLYFRTVQSELLQSSHRKFSECSLTFYRKRRIRTKGEERNLPGGVMQLNLGECSHAWYVGSVGPLPALTGLIYLK